MAENYWRVQQRQTLLEPQQLLPEGLWAGNLQAQPRGGKKGTYGQAQKSEEVKLLDMLKGGRSYVAVGRHYRINESSVNFIKEEENNIRMTAASFIKDAKTVCNRTMVRMEPALAL